MQRRRRFPPREERYRSRVYDPSAGERSQLLAKLGTLPSRAARTSTRCAGARRSPVGVAAPASYRMWDGIRAHRLFASRPTSTRRNCGCTVWLPALGRITSYLDGAGRPHPRLRPRRANHDPRRLFATIARRRGAEHASGRSQSSRPRRVTSSSCAEPNLRLASTCRTSLSSGARGTRPRGERFTRCSVARAVRTDRSSAGHGLPESHRLGRWRGSCACGSRCRGQRSLTEATAIEITRRLLGHRASASARTT